MNNFVKKEDVKWVPVKVIQETEDKWRYSVKMPDFLAGLDIFAVWEKERFLSMEANLKKGDVLFDIGPEAGWMSAIFAQFVGGENMVLFEPSECFWPNIRETWKQNDLKNPKATVWALAGNYTSANCLSMINCWPEQSEKNELIKFNAYRYLHDPHDTAAVPQIRIDDFVKTTGIVPDAMTIDCEGSELEILKGAENTLKNKDVKVWVSIHEDLMEKYFQAKSGDLIEYMKSIGYQGTHLATDHEAHWYFRKF
jgi:FkbM family methyltransferase